jgi:membrane associated rhomboid family serine protease
MNKEAAWFREGVFYSLGFVMVLWFVKSLEIAMSLELGFLGILPRTLSGTLGIITGPLVHGDFMHLLSNSFPLILLGIGVMYFYNKIAREVFLWIYFMTGIWVWIVARDAYHIGASGLVYGLVAFLLFSGLFRRDARSIAISLVVIFLYSGMLAGILPTSSSISWESHLLGAFAGIFCAFYFRNIPLYEKSKESALQPKEALDHNVQQEHDVIMYDIIHFTNTTPQEISYTYKFIPYSVPEKPPEENKNNLLITYTKYFSSFN